MPHSSRSTSARQIPNYANILLEDAHPDDRPAYMHLGYWEHPESRPLTHGVYQAQRELADLVINSASINDGDTVLDVGCGFGGLLQLLNSRRSELYLLGIDLSETQLDVCQALRPSIGNFYSWIYGDAVALPFSNLSIDAILTIEAAMHFTSRMDFFIEARRVLREGGTLTMIDILFDDVSAKRDGQSAIAIRESLEVDFYPLPEFGVGVLDLITDAAKSGFTCYMQRDLTANVCPTFTPDAYDEFPPGMMKLGARSAIGHFVELLSTGILKVYLIGLSAD